MAQPGCWSEPYSELIRFGDSGHADDLGALMKQNNQRDDDELRARLLILKEEMEAGRVHFAPHLKVLESLNAVRHGPDGKIDLSTVASGVRALANAATYSRQRREAKEAVSLRDLQSTYFDFIEKNFGWIYADMKKQGADPSQVASALAASPEAVKDIRTGMPEFLELIDELWKETWDSTHYHVQDIPGLKAVFGGETFPLGRKNIVSSSGVYADTIVLPDPFLRTRHFYDQDDSTAVRWFVKSAVSILHYRKAALAEVQVPLV
jgi:hypothetical protein